MNKPQPPNAYEAAKQQCGQSHYQTPAGYGGPDLPPAPPAQTPTEFCDRNRDLSEVIEGYVERLGYRLLGKEMGKLEIASPGIRPTAPLLDTVANTHMTLARATSLLEDILAKL